MSIILFYMKKVISMLLYPLGTVITLLILGLIIWSRKPRSKGGFTLVFAALLWLIAMSNPIVSDSLTAPLIREAGPYAVADELASKGIRTIVVLGGDVRFGNLSKFDQAATTSLLRVMEAVRLWKQIPGATIILSGGAINKEQMTTAAAMSNLAQELGVPRSALIVEDKSWDTAEEARLLADVIGKKPFALVTSASHMLRSIMIFRRWGLNPMPAPSDFESEVEPGYARFFPSQGALLQSQKAIHEYLGILLVLTKNIVRVR